MALRIIQVGVGGFGAGWLDLVNEEEDCLIAAIVDTDPRALEAAREKLGIGGARCFGTLERAMASVQCDAVLIVTPPAVHAEQAITAIESGKHVLIEKPLADSMEAARRTVACARTNDVVFMVSQNYRFRPGARAVRKIVADGGIGALGYVGVQFHKAPAFEGSYRLTMEYPLLMDMSIHHFDLIRYLTGADPVAVFARSWRPAWSWFDHEPAIAALFEMGNGITVNYFASWVSRGRETTWDGDWRLQGPDGAVVWRDDRIALAKPDTEFPIPPAMMSATDLRYSLHEFMRCVAGRGEPETSGADNLKTLAMVFGALESIKTGQRVSCQV
jgi:predicted dehydrogenase